MPKYVSNSIEISSDYSNKENSDNEDSDEEGYFERAI